MNAEMNDEQPQFASKAPRWGFVLFVMLYTIVIKLVPYVLYRYGMDVEENFAIYPWNFTPLFAVCLFGGALYQSRINALFIPLGVMFLADLGIWAITGKIEWAFYGGDQLIVYAATLLCAMIGFSLRGKRTIGKIAVAGVASCVSFFVITNFAVWMGSTTFSQNFSGLLACYAAGLPFLKNSLFATGLFSAILFSPACVREVSTEQQKSDFEFAPASAL